MALFRGFGDLFGGGGNADWRDLDYERGKVPTGGRRGGFNIGRAAMAFFSPDAAMLMGRRQAAREAAELAAQEEGRRMEALGGLGFSKDQITAMTSADASGLVRARGTPPTPNDTERDYEFMSRILGPEMARRYLENRANPMQAVDVQQADGSTRREFIRPPMGGGGPQAPPPGTIEGGHRFRGGDPADPANWEPVNQGGAGSAAGPRRFR